MTFRLRGGVDEWRTADRARGLLGYVQSTAPAGVNQISGHEERFLEGGTHQIGTQLDGLTRVGTGEYFYNGNTPADFAPPLGVYTEPGIYIAEAKYFADHRAAIVGGDTWGLDVVGNTTDVDPAYAFPAHTILIPKNGIRVGEGIITDSLAELGQHEFVYTYMGQYAYGCTAGNTSPVALVGS